jgi:hypothetical protein
VRVLDGHGGKPPNPRGEITEQDRKNVFEDVANKVFSRFEA